jgi:hypothetical protein
MDWLRDLLYFLFVPGLIIVAVLLAHRGNKQGYKIVKETNTLGESRYEVWFEYYTIHGCHGWLLKEKFDTEEQADEFIARQHKIREVIREGKL